MTKKIRAIGALILVVLWAALTVFAWFSPAKESSIAERRPLKQFPELTINTIMGGQFMSQFEGYALDQYPGRDLFRRLKAFVHYNVLRQKDNNSIYIADGYAVQMEYPLSVSNVDHALDRLNYVYEALLKDTDCTVYSAVIPDKGYYLSEENGYLAMDYQQLMQKVQTELSFATPIDLTDCLSADCYYYTDTHWRQEKIIPVAQKLCNAMGAMPPKAEDFTTVKADVPFYGVYYGQAALPMDSEDLYYLESQLLNTCKVLNYEAVGKDMYTTIYNMEKLSGNDPYEMFLSGPISLLKIQNPNASTNKSLIVFRDSFGSSLAPLLAQGYKSITLVDIRYIESRNPNLKTLLNCKDQDVLFLYSTLVLNNGTTLK